MTHRWRAIAAPSKMANVRNRCPRALSRLQVAFCCELLIDIDNHRPRDAQLIRERPSRWQTDPTAKRSGPDRLANLSLQLATEAFVGPPIELQQQFATQTGQAKLH